MFRFFTIFTYFVVPIIGLLYFFNKAFIELFSTENALNGLGSLSSIIGLLLSILIVYITANIRKIRENHDLAQRFEREREERINEFSAKLKSLEITQAPSEELFFELRQIVNELSQYSRFLNLWNIAQVQFALLLLHFRITRFRILHWILDKILNIYKTGIYAD